MRNENLKIKLFQSAEWIAGKNRVNDWYLNKCINIYKKHKIVYIHIPKAGGTTVANAIYGKRAGHYTAAEVSNSLGAALYHSMFSFSVIRNPYKRLESAYLYAKQGGGSQGGVRNLKVFQQVSFSTYQRFIEEWLPQQNPTQVPNLFRPQYQYIFNDDNHLLVNQIVKLENIQLLSDLLLKSTGRRFEFGKMNVTNKNSLPIAYTPSMVRCIQEWYKEDFELLGYSLESEIE